MAGLDSAILPGFNQSQQHATSRAGTDLKAKSSTISSVSRSRALIRSSKRSPTFG